jgi:hypothetical protein
VESVAPVDHIPNTCFPAQVTRTVMCGRGLSVYIILLILCVYSSTIRLVRLKCTLSDNHNTRIHVLRISVSAPWNLKPETHFKGPRAISGVGDHLDSSRRHSYLVFTWRLLPIVIDWNVNVTLIFKSDFCMGRGGFQKLDFVISYDFTQNFCLGYKNSCKLDF